MHPHTILFFLVFVRTIVKQSSVHWLSPNSSKVSLSCRSRRSKSQSSLFFTIGDNVGVIVGPCVIGDNVGVIVVGSGVGGSISTGLPVGFRVGFSDVGSRVGESVFTGFGIGIHCEPQLWV